MISWSLLTDDPGTPLQPWFIEGAPSGILAMPDIGNVFPTAPSQLVEPFQDLATDYVAFHNYPGVDEDEDVYVDIGLNTDVDFGC